MTKLFKKLSVIFIALCVMTAAVFASACTDYGDPAEMGYEITVLKPDGSPLKGADAESARDRISVVLTDDNNTQLNDENEGELDDYGVAHIVSCKIPGEYTININNIPKIYEYVPEKTRSDRARQTVVLKNVQKAYEINVVAPDGSPANGYDVAVKDGTDEIAKGKTDGQGKYVTPKINLGTYSVVVTEETGKIHHKSVKTPTPGFDMDEQDVKDWQPSVTVKTFEPKVITLDSAHKMTEEQLDDWIPKENNLVEYMSRLNDNYLFKAEARGTDETFYILHANERGNYTFNFRPDVLDEETGEHSGNYIVKFYNIDSYDEYEDTLTLDGSENGGRKCGFPLSMVKDQDWIFSVTSRDGRDHYELPMAISFNKVPEEQRAKGEGTYTLIYNENNEAVLEFSSDVSGMYKISLDSHTNNPKHLAYSNATKKPLDTVDSSVPLYAQAQDFPIIVNYPDDYISKDENGKVTGSETFLYHIFLDKVTTTSVKIKIERTGDAEPLTPDVEVTEVPAPTGLAQQVFDGEYETYSYSWHWLATDGTQNPVEKDGKWVVEIGGTEYDVYVAISKNFAMQDYSFATTEYVGGSNVRPGGSSGGDDTESGGIQTDRQNNRLAQVMEVGSQTVAYNYREFVEKYAELASKAQAPEQGASQAFNLYAAATDGVYALNAELKTFITRYMEGEWNNVVDLEETEKPAQPWLLACGYIVKTAK